MDLVTNVLNTIGNALYLSKDIVVDNITGSREFQENVKVGYFSQVQLYE